MTRLAQLSAELYRALPPENPAFLQVGSIEVARNEVTMRRFQDKVLRGAEASIEVHLLDTPELKALMPLMNVDGLIGGISVPSDGVLEPRRALMGLAQGISRAGVQVQSGTTVTSIEREHGKVVAVVTDKGRIPCDRVIVAVGIWGAAFLEKLDIELPLFPVQHPYQYTEPVAQWRDETREATHPFVRDLDNVTYYRQHGSRMGYGWYSHDPLGADMAALKQAELPYDDKLFKASLGLDLFPFLNDVPISRSINGIFSMTPDGLPLLGPVEAVDGLWLAEAVWVTHAGGIGSVAAEWLLEGHASAVDTQPFDPRRFGQSSFAQLKAQSFALYNDIYQWTEG